LRLVTLRTFKVFLSGEVKAPGTVEVNSATRASEAVNQVGLVEGASRRNITVQHLDGSAGRLDLDKLERMGQQDANPLLLDGDRLFVQYRPEYHQLMAVAVIGEIERPGSYPIVPGRDRLSDLVRWAGGFRPQANREAVHLVRETRSASERDPEFDRLVRLSRNDMTESEYTRLETILAERKNSFRVDWTRLRSDSATDPLLQDSDVLRVDRFVPTVRI